MKVELQDLSHSFFVKDKKIKVLNNVNLRINEGEILLILGPSGSGKTTLLNIIGGMLSPDKGRVLYDNISLYELNRRKQDEYRGIKVGFIFQMFYLIPDFNVLENVLVSMHLIKIGKNEKIKRAKELLKIVGLEDRMTSRPNQLSGGEQQRVAIARALANGSEFIIADEPTGNLDKVTTEEISKLFVTLKELGKTIVIVTHNESLKDISDRYINMSDTVNEENVVVLRRGER
jgi:putative ABC transport system ATP-binding protein